MSGTRATPLRGIVFALVALSLFGGSLVACAARPPLTSPEADLPSPRAALTPQPTPGLQFRLSAGSAQEDNASVLPPAPAEPLPAAETEQLLERLPPLTGAAGDVMELNLPKQTLPAPRPGKTIKQSFPPAPVPATAPEVATGALEVLRYAPEGDVPVAPNLNVTFNQPMVALTGLSDLAKAGVPVKLSPQPEGQWRWVGTKTLVFEPAAKTGFAAGRFPAATKYTVDIPGGNDVRQWREAGERRSFQLHDADCRSRAILSQRRSHPPRHPVLYPFQPAYRPYGRAQDDRSEVGREDVRPCAAV